MARRFIIGGSARTAVVAGALFAAASCSGGGSGAASAGSPTPSTSVTAACIAYQPKLAKRIVHFPSADAGGAVEAYVYGSGTVGIVIDHQSQQSLCDSMVWADTFAQQGYLAVAPSLDESEQVAETEGAIAYLRGRGATRIVLLGASMGGTAVLQTAAEARPPVQAVISVSGPQQYYPLDALSTAPKLTVPVFYSAGSGDGDLAAQETNVYNATTEKDKVLHIVPDSTAHGFDLLGSLLDLINAFIKAHVG